MDIDDQLKTIASGLIENLKVTLDKELRERISDEVLSQVAKLELDSIVDSAIKGEISARLSRFNVVDIGTQELTRVVNNTTDYINKQLIETARTQIMAEVNSAVSRVDLNQVVSTTVKSHLTSLLENLSFPKNSVPFDAVNFSDALFTGDMIKGGIIQEFGSTGIEDRASFVQLTLMDHAVVFEAPLYSPEFHATGNTTIGGNLTIDGNLIVLGEIPSECAAFKLLVDHSSEQTQQLLLQTLDDSWFSNYSRIIFDEIKERGLDLNRITQDGKDIVRGNQIGYHITDSNLQRVGHLVDLQTRGETLLSDTLYVTGKRAGVNTLDPCAAFVVWDEECEIVFTKRRQDVAYIGTQRTQTLILSSNNKDNIVLGHDGSVTIQNLVVNKVTMSSTATIPSHDAPRGQILFNESPEIGQPIGWVSLGGARWAKFGLIE